MTVAAHLTELRPATLALFFRSITRPSGRHPWQPELVAICSNHSVHPLEIGSKLQTDVIARPIPKWFSIRISGQCGGWWRASVALSRLRVCFKMQYSACLAAAVTVPVGSVSVCTMRAPRKPVCCLPALIARGVRESDEASRNVLSGFYVLVVLWIRHAPVPDGFGAPSAANAGRRRPSDRRGSCICAVLQSATVRTSSCGDTGSPCACAAAGSRP